VRTRTRLLSGFVGVHLVLSLVMGAVALRWVATTQREQAEEAARSVGRVLGGFVHDPGMVARARALTGYEFRVLDAAGPMRTGTVQVVESGVVIEIDYHSAAFRRASNQVILATASWLFGGALVFALVALWLSRQFARPVEVLAAAARTIGGGDLDAAVPAVGQGEVRALAGDLEHMRARIRELDAQHRQAERLATLGTFAATIAHEVRNPLSAVRLTAQLLARKHSDEPGLRLIGEELERLDYTIDELLSYSKGLTVAKQPCVLRPLAEDVVRLLRRQGEHAGVTLAVSGEATVSADPARVRQLLLNLVLNAIQAQHGGGRVEIAVASDGLSVLDNGPGVDPQVVPRLFEAFASGRPGGTGLGLHLAWSIAVAHGATLAYRRRAEGGSAFVLGGLQAG